MFLEDDKQAQRYFTNFNMSMLPENMPLWMQLVRDPCFMGQGSQLQIETGEKARVMMLILLTMKLTLGWEEDVLPMALILLKIMITFMTSNIDLLPDLILCPFELC